MFSLLELLLNGFTECVFMGSHVREYGDYGFKIFRSDKMRQKQNIGRFVRDSLVIVEKSWEIATHYIKLPHLQGLTFLFF